MAAAWTSVHTESSADIYATYTLAPEDSGSYLRATATYGDEHASDNTASSVTSHAVLALATVPAKPAAPTLVAGNQQIISSWTEPDDNGARPITEYEVQWKAASAVDWTGASSPEGKRLHVPGHSGPDQRHRIRRAGAGHQ